MVTLLTRNLWRLKNCEWSLFEAVEDARYAWVYNRSSKYFKDKNKKANSWEKIGEKFNFSAAEAEVKFRNIRTVCGRYLKRFKTIPSGSSWIFFEPKTDVSFGFEADGVVALGLKEEINLLAANVVYCDFPASTTRVYIWHFRWPKYMATVGSAIACDRLRLYGTQLS